MTSNNISYNELSLEHIKQDNILKLKTKQNKSFGIFLILSSALIFSIMTLFIRAAAEKGIPPFEMLVIRCFIQIFYSIFLCLWNNLPPFGDKEFRNMLILRGLFGSLSGGCLYYGASHIGISDATVLAFSTPIWTPFIARVFISEKITYIHSISIIIGFIGVIFVSQPAFIFNHFKYFSNIVPSSSLILAKPGSIQYLFGAFICILGAIFTSIAYVIIRKLGGKVEYQILVFYYAIVGIFASCILALVFEGIPIIPKDNITLIYLLIISICGCLGQTTLNRGGQLIDASKTSVLRNTDVAFVLIWQIIFLDEYPTIFSMIGLVLICSCTILIALKSA